MAEAWPFAARDDDLAAAEKALGEHGTVVLGGPAGVGKSRLARELAARDHGAVLGVVRATASAQEIPLGALLDVLPDLDPATTSVDLSHVRDAVAALAGGEADRLLVVDDAHLLDPASATVVHQIAAGRQARLVLTVRSGEPAPDAVTALWKDGTAARLDLAPFEEHQTHAVLASVLDTHLEAGTARRLHDTARGNVLWLHHLVDGERAAGRLRQDGGSWIWEGTVALSPALDDLVATRIGTLTDDERRVLELLSVSEPLGLGMLERLAGAAAVEEVSQRGLVSVEPDGERWEVRLGHPLYGESVRARTSVPRARRLRSELSDALARTGGRRAGDGLRRAVLDLGSDRPHDPDELVAASVQASGLRDFRLAERLLRAAIAAGGGFPARLGLAHLLDYEMRGEEADAVLEETADVAATPGEREQAVILRGLAWHFQADPPRSGEELLAAEEAEHHGGSRNPAFDPLRAMFLGVSGRVHESIELAGAVLADDTRPMQQQALAAFVVGHVRSLTGGARDLAATIERGIETAAHNPETAAVACNVGYMEIVDADLGGHRETARHRLEWVRGLGGPQAPPFVALYEGRMALSAGRPRTAIGALESALPAFPGHGGGWGAWASAMIAQSYGTLGDAAAARTWVEEAERRRHPHIPIIGFENDLAQAWAAVAAGSTREGIERTRAGAERCRGRGIHAAEVVLRQTSVRFGDREQAGRLAELDRLLATPRSRLAAAHAAALARSDAERLLAVAEQLHDAGMNLEAADAAGQAATTARSAQRLVVAARAEERARALAAPCEDATTPALQAAGAPIPLSAREREVAVLAGEGLTNRQIAARLHVSVRTVESHVYRACTRLGLPDRSALVAVAATGRGSSGTGPSR
ncbi:LuxR C-terminal-related transcriptional regulator [Actinomycetospora endophytica]|uniref:LuxR C-terminal-related transcriptional regulator n=1 Tax=Actinomycetospora endophytica TaxID=2291215 RepID=A0ABS8PBI8_9PSEU|nr:LuxR C-terminal-related transcriptional regulator [Actinomycetospora endophytica]MCD2194786.1 LuxR C-terminal-related transcriptional regulator [Actinomycetospora endophytica]